MLRLSRMLNNSSIDLMRKRTFLILSSVFCAAMVCAFFGFAHTSAQTTKPADRARQTATPTPAPVTPKPTPAPTPNPDDEVIKIDTELVNLNVRVIDRNNRPINNIKQNEFKIYEDNVLQDIAFFSKSEVPTNYGLVIDNSGSLRFQLEKVIEASKIIVGTNKPADETMVIRFVSSQKIEIIQDFTANKAELNDALENLFTEGGQTAIIDAIYLAAEKVDQYENSRKGDRMRRALILVSDGEDRDSFYKEAQLFELLRETDVQIYAIGFVSELSKESGFISKSPQGKAKAFLQRLADETGGKAYFPASPNELNTIATDIASELRTQYSIGYQPSNDKNDGSFRNIRVVVDDGPNKQKRIAVTRSGRTAESGNNTPPSLQAPTQTKVQ